MKKTLSVLFALLMSCITASAQIQNGYVRSQGTSYNRTGSPLKGARVFVKGLNGSKVTAPNGTFNFNLGGGKTQFCISSVTLKDYTLLSPLAPAYNVGKAAVEIVMQSREERIQNEARISKVIEERITKSYNAKTRELQKKITTLEKALSDKKKNSDELETQIRSLKEQLGNLDNQYLKRNELIDKMVEEYVNLDYATMNNRKAELCSYIEKGELEKADSLLNTIDINKEMNDIKTLNRDIEEKESMLSKEKEIRKNKIETACMYWRGKYDIAIQNMQYDSAAVYVKNLADVDTCNFENVFDCATFFHKQNRFKEAEEYYTVCLNNVGRGENNNSPQVLIWLYNNLGILYKETHRFNESEKKYKATKVILDFLAQANPKAYEPYLAEYYNNLASLYVITNQFKESEDMHKAAIKIYEQLVQENPNAYNPELAISYNNLARLYVATNRFKEGEEFYKAALAIRELLAIKNPNAYNPELAISYNDLATLYMKISRYKESEDMQKAALVIREQLAKDNPNAYIIDLAESYNNLAVLYMRTRRFKECEDVVKKALLINEQQAKEHKNAYELDLAISYTNLAILYRYTHRYIESENMHKAVIQIYEQLAKVNPSVYDSYLANSYFTLANLYSDTHRYIESENMHKAAILIYEQLAKGNPNVYDSYLAGSYFTLANLYSDTYRYIESENMHKAVIQIYEQLAKVSPRVYDSYLADSYFTLAKLYSDTHRFKEGEDMHKAAIAIRESLTKENPNVYSQYLAASYYNLAILYYNSKCFKESEEMYKEAMLIYEKLYESNPQLYQKRLSENYYWLGILMVKNNKYHDAIIQFECSLKLCNNIEKAGNDLSLYVSSLGYLVDLYSNEKDYTKAFSYNEVLLPLLKVNYEENAQDWKTEYYNKELNQSFYANLLGKFKEGEQYSLEAIKIYSTQYLAYTNLAAAILLQGRFEEAEKLYREYKAEFKDNFIDDFAEFERLGVIPEEHKADVERIKAILNE